MTWKYYYISACPVFCRFCPWWPTSCFRWRFFWGVSIVLILTNKSTKNCNEYPFYAEERSQVKWVQKNLALLTRQSSPGIDQGWNPVTTWVIFWGFTLRIYPAITQDLSSVQKGYGSEFKPGLSCVQNPGSHPGFWYKRGINVTFLLLTQIIK